MAPWFRGLSGELVAGTSIVTIMTGDAASSTSGGDAQPRGSDEHLPRRDGLRHDGLGPDALGHGGLGPDGLGHDLRNALTSALMCLELLAEQEAVADDQDSVWMVERALVAVRRIDQLLTER